MRVQSDKNFYAVVMGDLVQSERAHSPEHLHAVFNTAIEDQNDRQKDRLVSPLTITLGDEFQGLTRSLADTLPVTRNLRYRLLRERIDCRFTIGLVKLSTPINTNKAWNMMGTGLSRARDKLNEKNSNSLYRFSIVDEPLLETTLEALGVGLTTIERRWTDQQRNDIVALLSGYSASEIAKRRNVSVHSVYKVRGSGDFDAYIVQWSAIQEILVHMDRRYGLI